LEDVVGRPGPEPDEPVERRLVRLYVSDTIDRVYPAPKNISSKLNNRRNENIAVGDSLAKCPGGIRQTSFFPSLAPNHTETILSHIFNSVSQVQNRSREANTY
jgi:hypothetical protein